MVRSSGVANELTLNHFSSEANGKQLQPHLTREANFCRRLVSVL